MTVQHVGSADAGSADAVGGAAVQVRADSGITSLNPEDGLFLRAEHLRRMQDYARDLVAAVGMAAGSGVVHGYSVVLGADELQVGTGLAMDGSGRPLRSRQNVTLPLVDLVPVPNRFWVLEVAAAAPRPFGEENTYGTICDDPCAASPLRPWLADGVTIRLVADTKPDLDDGSASALRRNRLASWYFERERRGAAPWLTPTATDTAVGSITQRDWAAGTGAPPGEAVPLAVLARGDDDEWLLDVWTARRDIGDPHPRRAWQARLAMRPWDVFVAQVLQFQAQLAGTLGSAVQFGAASREQRLADERVGALVDLVLDKVKSTKVRAAAEAVQSQKSGAAVAGAALGELGFAELPPAGYLPNVRPDGEDPNDLRGHFQAVFGGNVDVTVCRCSADAVARAVEAAQHLDRIPLGPAEPRPQVLVLVPGVPADLEAVRAQSYGWVAFVRGRALDCGAQVRTEEVDVHHEFVAEDDVVSQITEHGRPSSEAVATAAYRAGETSPVVGVGVPIPSGVDVVDVVVATSQDARAELLTKRGAVLVAELAGGAVVPVVAVVAENVEREAIVLLLRARIG